MRVTLMAMLGKVRIPLQVDVGAGDAVVPPARHHQLSWLAGPSAGPRTCLSTRNINRRENRGDGTSRAGE